MSTITTTRCQCGHGPSRHFHADGTTSCRICTTCRSFRPRCTHLAYSKGRGGTRWPGQCSRNAVQGSEYCRQHGGADQAPKPEVIIAAREIEQSQDVSDVFAALAKFESATKQTRQIDRVTTHTCAGFEADTAYFAAQGRDLFSCGEGHPRITVHYAQYPAICAECRIECLDESDVASDTCAWCGEVL